MRTPRLPTPALGLRARVMAAFVVGAALVSLVLALSVHTVTREYLTDQRLRSAERQASGDAEFVRARLERSAGTPQRVLADLAPPAGTVVLLLVQGRWYSSQPGVGPEVLPGDLRTRGPADLAPPISVTVAGEPFLLVRGRLGDGVTFYEVVPLRGLRAALRAVDTALVSCGIAATLGAAMVGWVVSRRLLRPLRELAATATRVADGDLDERVPITRDPDLAAIARSVNRMVDSLQRRIEREHRFFGDVSHELRNPVTTLTTAVGVLRRYRHDLPARADAAFDLVETDVARLRRLLDHLLALARAEAGSSQDERETLSLAALIENVLTATGHPASLLAVERDGKVKGSELALERALVNLVDNADRHGKGLAGVTVDGDSTHATVFVDDRGAGVPPDQRTAIFQRFHTGRTTPNHHGTGLGLALVAEIVAAHGGRVHCIERPGGGTRMVVTIPITQAERDKPNHSPHDLEAGE